MSCGSNGPCLNLAPCSGRNCTCAVGYFGPQCESRWKDTDPTAFAAVQYTLLSLNALVFVMCVVLVCQYWFKRVIAFPRLNKAMCAQATLAASSVFGLLTYAVDPYRFVASAGGYLTQSYRAGLSVLSNLFLGLVGCAYLFLAATWLTIMTSEGRWARDEWTIAASVSFFVLCALILIMSGVCAALWMVLLTSLADTIFLVFLAVIAVAISVTVLIGAISTVRDLHRFQAKNKTLTRSVATHAITVVVGVVMCAVLLAALSLGPVNTSFAAFLYARTLVPGLAAVAMRLVLMWHYRQRDRLTHTNTASSPVFSRSLDSTKGTSAALVL